MTFSYGGLGELEELDFPLLYRSNPFDCHKGNADFSVTLPARTEVMMSCPSGLSATSSNMVMNTMFLALQFTIVQTAGIN
ncbi:hypothetical protein DUI87_10247 [Hirundo rustica rustica]|uniref:Uncharacterized protein n=1 Tax=Hirundo rustica rustica TaxID=333673 RepID=A0A3M0KHN1_HIRRU|nr:hypothetical protein DUI87_10247 [Hirundo rustica rustica]